MAGAPTTPGPTRLRKLPACADAGAAAVALADALSAALDTIAAGASGFVRIEQPLDTAPDALAWLSARPHAQRLYFETKDATFPTAGLGVGASWQEGVGEARALLTRLAGDPASAPLRFLLSHRFDRRPGDGSAWAAFGRTRLLLPLLELRRDHGAFSLSVNLDGHRDDVAARVAEARALLARPPATTVPRGRATAVSELPDEAHWTHAVDATLEEISTGQLAKCVLARTRTYDLDTPTEPFALLAQAAAAQPDTFRFGIQVADDLAFVGATPEVLYRRAGREIESEALAGTRLRSDAAEEDARLGAELLQSPKDLAEHALVRTHIESVLEPLCRAPLAIEGPALRRLSGIQHLDTRLSGTLEQDPDDAALLEGLHPTPAVCGVPTEAAERVIDRREPFDRGLYAGAVGLLSRDEAVVTVGIRSALVHGPQVTLLAGAGIVQGSDARAEWQETSDKMQVLDGILRGEGPLA